MLPVTLGVGLGVWEVLGEGVSEVLSGGLGEGVREVLSDGVGVGVAAGVEPSPLTPPS